MSAFKLAIHVTAGLFSFCYVFMIQLSLPAFSKTAWSFYQ